MKSLLALVLIGTSSATFHRRPTLPNGWVQSELTTLTESPVAFVLSIAESAESIATIKKAALAVSNPLSNQYGNYLSSAQIAAVAAAAHEDIELVTSWLQAHGISSSSYTVRGGRVEVESTTGRAEALLKTTFAPLVNKDTAQAVLRAGDYHLPDEIEDKIAAVFGLHGLPLPPRRNLVAAPVAKPAAVVPAVIEEAYNFSGVQPHAEGNVQAVTEFQGQYMSEQDLTDWFKKYVANYTVGKDDKVSKFVGDMNKQDGQQEATLDIQYIMGITPGLKTEFWLFSSMDFCGDLANWTATLLSDENPPLVHSVSYGWQGDLGMIHCEDDKITVVDNNLAKLAAKGITVIFASGDTGSGYQTTNTQCKEVTDPKTAYTGIVESKLRSRSLTACCLAAEGAQGYTFVAAAGPAPMGKCYQLQDGQYFTGQIVNSSIVLSAEDCCQMSQGPPGGMPSFAEWTFYAHNKTCNIFGFGAMTVQGPKNASVSGYAPTPMPAEGNCTVWASITGKKADATADSSSGAAVRIVLWPSWPASSGWVTSVGATRFIGQKAGAEEMATDQFGSGGGFSWMFNYSTDAAYQTEAVQAYLETAKASLPPAQAFPTFGRGTPDVSALGEGYQVLINGSVSSVGGTSASTPTFAGLISLINDARLLAGRKPMGFLNPFIYQNTQAFTDITKGQNAIGRGDITLPYGFNCTKGWDPVTGVGSPIFDKMLLAAMEH